MKSINAQKTRADKETTMKEKSKWRDSSTKTERTKIRTEYVGIYCWTAAKMEESQFKLDFRINRIWVYRVAQYHLVKSGQFWRTLGPRYSC